MRYLGLPDGVNLSLRADIISPVFSTDVLVSSSLSHFCHLCLSTALSHPFLDSYFIFFSLHRHFSNFSVPISLSTLEKFRSLFISFLLPRHFDIWLLLILPARGQMCWETLSLPHEISFHLHSLVFLRYYKIFKLDTKTHKLKPLGKIMR